MEPWTSLLALILMWNIQVWAETLTKVWNKTTRVFTLFPTQKLSGSLQHSLQTLNESGDENTHTIHAHHFNNSSSVFFFPSIRGFQARWETRLIHLLPVFRVCLKRKSLRSRNVWKIFLRLVLKWHLLRGLRLKPYSNRSEEGKLEKWRRVWTSENIFFLFFTSLLQSVRVWKLCFEMCGTDLIKSPTCQLFNNKPFFKEKKTL